ncbi:MAG: tRNA uridine-5-carboxymethylaminomethyl(34) synthesis GTPase MnmE, partial [Eubacteriales bacterium]|nr:tRNA uridine-5-carboxymethylaminomethyl(34) synthesis GTPase MnmE [Eubacteriales bacterium]
MSDTIAAISTGAQVSAIGIVRLSGDDAINIVSKLFHPFSGIKMAEADDRKLVFGDLCDRNGELLDKCLCTVSRAPHSYTGENTAELQCHGSPVLLRAVLDELFASGARQALPGEFSKRAFLNGCMDLTSAEAVIDIIDAETIDAAKNAAGQLSGAIHKKIDTIYNSLVDLCSHYHAVLDYPDEDIEDFQLTAYSDLLSQAIRDLKSLLATFDHGKIMKSGIPAAIVGRPNAGKSSLLNALLGYDRAIVTSVPGTTRDTIEEKVKIGRNILRLTDTAGIRETTDEVEKLGVSRSRAAIDQSELVIAVFDAASEFTEEDSVILDEARNAPHCIPVISKTDLSPADSVHSAIKGRYPEMSVVEISSITGEGLDDLRYKIDQIYPFP